MTLAKFVSLEDYKPLLPIRTDGHLKVLVTKNNGKRSFSLAILVDESNEEFFKRLELSLSQLASMALPGTK